MLLEWFLRFIPSVPTSNQNDPGDIPPKEGPENGAATPGGGGNNQSGGILANATGFTIGEANMFDHPQFNSNNNNTFNHQTIHNTIVTGTAALERILPHTCPGAAVDSSARHPPPQCHPGTRQRILSTLGGWLENPKRLWKMIWLSGPAGTGKSAVAQTFAETCLEKFRLGAAYFFSRPHKRNDPKTIIPTLAYQLAVNLPEYGTLLANVVAHDLTIFEKTPRVQLRKLIVEPFSLLQSQGHRIVQEPLLIILDGLDECKGIDAQCEIVEMIGEVIRLKGNLPLLWLISSRPEPHLKYIFSRADFSIDCGKERLLIDAETRDDVERFLRDSFNDIRAKFPYVTDASWPSEAQSKQIEDIASGLFVLASTITRYVGDSTYANPVGRLVDFLAFMENADRGFTTNPLETLDLLYSQILADIPEDVIPITRRILSLTVVGEVDGPVHLMCNFLRLGKHEFYNAVGKLHSLFDVPPPETAVEVSLKAYHTSFSDYIQSLFRSGRFFISEQEARVNFTKACLFWYKTYLEDACYISDGSFRVAKDASKGAALAGLSWSSSDTSLKMSQMLRKLSRECWVCFGVFVALSKDDTQDLLGQLEDFDFRYIKVDYSDDGAFSGLANWLFKCAPPNTLMHTESCNELEKTLLSKAASELDRTMEPVVFPIHPRKHGSKSVYTYIFIGRGTRTCLFWFDEVYKLCGRCRLSCNALPGESYTVSDCVIHEPE